MSDFAKTWQLGWGRDPCTSLSVDDLLAASCQNRREQRVSRTDTSTFETEFSVPDNLDIDFRAGYFA